MIEIVSKLTEVLKSSHFPLLFLSLLHFTRKTNIKEDLIADEIIPGDNFPQAVISHYIGKR